MPKKFRLREAGDRGWFVGSFERAVLKTDAVEAALQHNLKGETSPAHYHKIATEVNLIISGMVKINGEIYIEGQGVVFYPDDICECEYLDDTTTMVIKVPGPLNDKYLV